MHRSVSALLLLMLVVALAACGGEEEKQALPETTIGTTATRPTTTGGGSGEGDAAAGKAVFGSAACGSCHTLADAGASGAVGPNLDETTPDHDLVVDRVTNGKGVMPAFEDDLSEKQIQDVAAYVSGAAGA